MYCPTCTTTPLVLAQRQNVEIDYCPHCRGVWLDRGELDKLLERAAHSSDGVPHVREPQRDTDRRFHDRRERHRKSWLSEIFD